MVTARDALRRILSTVDDNLRSGELQMALTLLEQLTGERGHDGYADVIDGGYGGYIGRCWTCDWEGEPRPPGRDGKAAARADAYKHSEDTMETLRKDFSLSRSLSPTHHATAQPSTKPPEAHTPSDATT